MDWRRFMLFVGIVLLMAGVMMIIYSDFIVSGWDPIYQKHMSSYLEAWRNIGIVLLSSGIVIIIGTGYSYLKQNRRTIIRGEARASMHNCELHLLTRNQRY